MKNIGICFSKELTGETPLSHIVIKLPVYMRFLEMIKAKGWGAYMLTKKTYIGNGVFDGGWIFDNGKFTLVKDKIKIDLVYDRSAGVDFPPLNDESTIWVNGRNFKVLAWDKWTAYKAIGKYMPQTLFIENEKDISSVVSKIKTDWVVLKPFNGLKGLGVFIGPKEKAVDFNFDEKFDKYIAQEFVDTSGGIPGLTDGLHDLRIAIVNGKIVWSHIRVPEKGSYLANAARGGNLTEVSPELIPENIKDVVIDVASRFFSNYDNPVYSLDFGVGKGGRPYIFEINDQIGFPKWEMKNRDNFLSSLVANFESKL
jgi:glutathione synthase/RimK-type ligase-like ATP-grasp enzyme